MLTESTLLLELQLRMMATAVSLPKSGDRPTLASSRPSLNDAGLPKGHDQLDETLGTERLTATLSAAFGILATLLAAVGLYGVMALTVARRTREIGLRMALGARQGALLWMVMREAFGLFGAGLALGVPCAYLLGRYVSSQLFGVLPADLGTAVAALMALADGHRRRGFRAGAAGQQDRPDSSLA